MKVYVVERGVYSDRYIEGVYATVEAAMAANPGGKFELDETVMDGVVWRRWLNDLDWESACAIAEYEVPAPAVADNAEEIAAGAVLAERARIRAAVEGLAHVECGDLDCSHDDLSYSQREHPWLDRAAVLRELRAKVERLSPMGRDDYLITALDGTTRRPTTPADWVESYRSTVLAAIDEMLSDGLLVTRKDLNEHDYPGDTRQFDTHQRKEADHE